MSVMTSQINRSHYWPFVFDSTGHFMRGIQLWPDDSPHKRSIIIQKAFLCHDFIVRRHNDNQVWFPHMYISHVYAYICIYTCVYVRGGIWNVKQRTPVSRFFHTVFVDSQYVKFTNPTVHLPHIPQCIIQDRNVYTLVLNGALRYMGQVRCGICEAGL